jgi:hypothetical protein
MKRRAWYLLIGLLVGSMLWAQGHKSDPSTQQDQPPSDEDRPTLGPRTGPVTEGGPPTAKTIDLRKLRRIHTLYIENIDNLLSDKIVEALGKSGPFRLVSKEKGADATLRGTCLESRHLKHLHTEVYISDSNGASVWQDIIYRPFNPPTLDKAVNETAAMVVAHLEQSLRMADSR